MKLCFGSLFIGIWLPCIRLPVIFLLQNIKHGRLGSNLAYLKQELSFSVTLILSQYPIWLSIVVDKSMQLSNVLGSVHLVQFHGNQLPCPQVTHKTN